jgi:hypothetical protein
MKKLILGLAAVGAVLALRPVIKRRMVQEMSAHCRQMAARCKQMMGDHEETSDRETMHQKMREHGEGMPAQYDDPTEPVVAA